MTSKRTTARLAALPAEPHVVAALQSPLALAWIAMVRELERAAADPAIAASADHAELLGIFIEIAGDAVLQAAPREVLDTLHRLLSNRGGGSQARANHREVRKFHASAVKSIGSRYGATSATAAHFGLSTRQVRAIIAVKQPMKAP